MTMEWAACVARGDWAAAWRINDAVLAARNPAERDDPRLPYHLRWVWDGRAFEGRDVLVRCYHGLGDTLMFARFLPALRRRVARLTVEAPPPLLPLLEQVPGPDAWAPFDPAAPLPPADRDLEIGELPHALRLTPADALAPYLRATPAGRGGVGLCWQGGGWDSSRDIPPTLLAPLFAIGAAFTALCPAPTALPVRNPHGCPADIAATASLIAGLDLVVTVDTMVAHLAGALGRPTWLLLKHAPDWRWRGGGDRSAWYSSLRLFRQTAPGDWDGVVGRVAAALLSPVI